MFHDDRSTINWYFIFCAMLFKITCISVLICSTTIYLYAQIRAGEAPQSWTRFTTESGLPTNHVGNIFELSDGTPWVSTPLGLAWFDGCQWTPIDSSRGLPRSVTQVVDFNDSLVALAGEPGRKLYIGTKTGFHLLSRERNVQWFVPLTGTSLLAA